MDSISSKIIEERVHRAQKIASDYDYLNGEFQGKLWGQQDGSVTLVAMIKFAKEYDYLLEHIIALSKEI